MFNYVYLFIHLFINLLICFTGPRISTNCLLCFFIVTLRPTAVQRAVGAPATVPAAEAENNNAESVAEMEDQQRNEETDIRGILAESPVIGEEQRVGENGAKNGHDHDYAAEPETTGLVTPENEKHHPDETNIGREQSDTEAGQEVAAQEEVSTPMLPGIEQELGEMFGA